MMRLYDMTPISTYKHLQLSVGLTGQVYLLEIEGLCTQGSQPCRTVGASVGGMFGMDTLNGRPGFDTTTSIPALSLSINTLRVDILRM